MHEPPKWVEGIPDGYGGFIPSLASTMILGATDGELIEELQARGYLVSTPEPVETQDDPQDAFAEHAAVVLAGYGLRSGLHKDRGYDLLP